MAKTPGSGRGQPGKRKTSGLHAKSPGLSALRRKTPAPEGEGKASPAGGTRKLASALRRRTPTGGAAVPAGGDAGAEIGIYHRRGMSVRQKFGLVISLSFGLVALIVGLSVTSFFRANLWNEIVRYGYGQVVSLRSFGQRVFDDVREGADTARQYPESERQKADQQLLQTIVEAEPRLFSISVLVSPTGPTENPSAVAAHGGTKPTEFGPPADAKIIHPPGDDNRVQIWQSTFTSEEGTVPALFFRAPIELQGEKPLATVLAVTPISHIDMEVRALSIKLTIFGLIFLGAGIAIAMGLAAAVSKPVSQLVADMDIIARGNFDHKPQIVSRDELGLLALALSQMTKSLSAARDQEVQMQRLSSDLDLAQEIVARLMPSKLPKLPGIDPGTLYYAAREVGGDYYDFIPVDNEHLAFLVADVSGKSIGGALVVSTTRTILRLMAPMNLSPADVLSKVNFHVARDIRRGMFVTVFYGILNVRTREFTVSSAGHNPMMLYRAATKEVEMINPTGMALGFDRGTLFDKVIKEQKIALHRGDRVLLYTDGIVESMDEKHEEWGDDKLIAFLKNNGDQKSRDFTNALKQAIADHQGNAEQHDDITAVTFKIE